MLKQATASYSIFVNPPRGFFRRNYPLLNGVWLALDVGIAAIVFLLATAYLLGGVIESYRILSVALATVMFPVYQWAGVFKSVRARSVIFDLGLLLKAFAFTVAAVIALGFSTATLGYFNPGIVAISLGLAFFAQTVMHLGIRGAISFARHHSMNTRTALLVGSDNTVMHFHAMLSRNTWLGIRVVGYVTPDPHELIKDHEKAQPLAHLGTFDQLGEVLASRELDIVYLAMPMEFTPAVSKIAKQLLSFSVDVAWVPDLSSFLLIGQGVREIEGYPVITLSESPMNGLSRLTKRAIDLLGASLLILILSPLLIVTGILVKASSPGPIIFKQLRHGINGKPITIWKFRSMYVGRPTTADRQVRRFDKDVTPIGRFIRRWSIDELPQLVQVVTGAMSLVGPRPHPLWLNDQFVGLMEGYMQRHRVKPGLVGWAQIHGWRGETDIPEKMEMRWRYDIYYIQNWSIWLDIGILLAAPFAILRGDNAH